MPAKGTEVRVEYRNDIGSLEWVCTFESLMGPGITIGYIPSIPQIIIPPRQEKDMKKQRLKLCVVGTSQNEAGMST